MLIQRAKQELTKRTCRGLWGLLLLLLGVGLGAVNGMAQTPGSSVVELADKLVKIDQALDTTENLLHQEKRETVSRISKNVAYSVSKSLPHSQVQQALDVLSVR